VQESMAYMILFSDFWPFRQKLYVKKTLKALLRYFCAPRKIQNIYELLISVYKTNVFDGAAAWQTHGRQLKTKLDLHEMVSILYILGRQKISDELNGIVPNLVFSDTRRFECLYLGKR
jgi:hypothetical protein